MKFEKKKHVLLAYPDDTFILDQNEQKIKKKKTLIARIYNGKNGFKN